MIPIKVVVFNNYTSPLPVEKIFNVEWKIYDDTVDAPILSYFDGKQENYLHLPFLNNDKYEFKDYIGGFCVDYFITENQFNYLKLKTI